jgi:hypothetical protein
VTGTKDAAMATSGPSAHTAFCASSENGLLCLFGKLTDTMGVVDHEAGTPTMGRVGFADLADHVKPGVEAESVPSEAGRDQNTGDACVEKFLNRFCGYPPSFLRPLSAFSEAQDHPPDAVNDFLLCRRLTRT